MIVGHSAVKHSQGDEKNRPHGGRADSGRFGLRTSRARLGWLEGWALILPSAGLAIVAAALAVPRATAPKWVPEPVVHPSTLAAELRRTAGLAAHARTHPLPYVVRELGEAYRRLGRTQYDLVEPLVGMQVQAWQAQVRAVQTSVGNPPVLQLRALQCELLVEAIQNWQSTGLVNDDLAELGGDLVRIVQANRSSLTQSERWAIALKRWTNIAGLGKQVEFHPQRDLELTQLHFFYENPAASDEPVETRIRILKRYADLDPTYPVDYALGTLFSLNGRIDTAVTFFARHLEAHPNGAFALLARNHLIWAARQLGSAGDDGRP